MIRMFWDWIRGIDYDEQAYTKETNASRPV